MIRLKSVHRLLATGLILFGLACHNPLYDEPPLHDAAKRGNLKKVKQLLKEGVPVNSRNREGATPLHWAAFKGHAEVAKLLLKKGASVNALTKKGSSPLRLANDYDQKEVVKVLKRYGAK